MCVVYMWCVCVFVCVVYEVWYGVWCVYECVWCVCGVRACVYVCVCAWCPQRLEEGVTSLRTGGTVVSYYLDTGN